jgi:hypothetical protein
MIGCKCACLTSIASWVSSAKCMLDLNGDRVIDMREFTSRWVATREQAREQLNVGRFTILDGASYPNNSSRKCATVCTQALKAAEGVHAAQYLGTGW